MFVVIDCRDSFIYNVVASLRSLGVMPVNSIGSIRFGSRAVAEIVQRTYVKDVDAGL